MLATFVCFNTSVHFLTDMLKFYWKLYVCLFDVKINICHLIWTFQSTKHRSYVLHDRGVNLWLCILAERSIGTAVAWTCAVIKLYWGSEAMWNINVYIRSNSLYSHLFYSYLFDWWIFAWMKCSFIYIICVAPPN